MPVPPAATPPAGILGREAGEKQVEMGPEIALDIDTRRFAARTTHLQMHGPGVTVPPASVTGLEFGAGPNRIDGLDRRRRATVEAELAGGRRSARLRVVSIDCRCSTTCPKALPRSWRATRSV